MFDPAGPPIPPGDRLGLGGIASIRRGLALGADEEALVHRIGPDLTPYVPGWVDGFYTRLLTDADAMRILDDDARIIRLKRSLVGWFHDLFTRPWDEEYERSREMIGEAHVRILMPTHLMVVSMSRLRQDVSATIERIWDGDPEEARQISSVVGRALDMELTLMLLAFRRSERAAGRQKDRMVYAQRAARRFAQTLYDRVDAALCYAELAEVDDARRSDHLMRLKGVLRGLAHHDQRLQVQAQVEGLAAGRTSLSELCRKALDDVSVDAHTRIRLDVQPPDLTMCIVGQAVHLAVEELAQNAARHAAGGRITVRARATPDDQVVIEVTDEGPGWGPGVREFKDIYALGSGLGLSFCELVAELHDGSIELFEAAGGGAGVRLTLQQVEAPGP